MSLPPGWEARKDRTGKLYFVDHKNKETSWVDPRKLPQGWEEKYDTTTKRKYYANHNEKRTQWHDPRPEPIIGVTTPFDQSESGLYNDFKKLLIKQNKSYEKADRDWYVDVLRLAIIDDSLTPDEDMLLAQVRNKLKITDDENKAILSKLGLTEATLKAKRKDESNGAECCLCLSETASWVILNCMHICLCGACAENLKSKQKKECPKCRVTFVDIKQTF